MKTSHFIALTGSIALGFVALALLVSIPKDVEPTQDEVNRVLREDIRVSGMTSPLRLDLASVTSVAKGPCTRELIASDRLGFRCEVNVDVVWPPTIATGLAKPGPEALTFHVVFGKSKGAWKTWV